MHAFRGRNWQLYAAILLVALMAQFRMPVIEFLRHPISETMERFSTHNRQDALSPMAVEARLLLTRHAIDEYRASRLFHAEENGLVYQMTVENLWPLRVSSKARYMLAMIEEELPENIKEIDRMHFIKLVAPAAEASAR
jgi:hypothetical protein